MKEKFWEDTVVKKRKIMYVFLIAFILIITSGLLISRLNKTDKIDLGNEKYKLSEIQTDHWHITGGEFWINGYDQGYRINEIKYTGSKSFETTEINAIFYLYAIDENGKEYKKTIFDYRETYDDNRLYQAGDVIFGGGATGQLPNQNYNFIFDYMYVDISNDDENTETIKIPLTKEE